MLSCVTVEMKSTLFSVASEYNSLTLFHGKSKHGDFFFFISEEPVSSSQVKESTDLIYCFQCKAPSHGKNCINIKVEVIF